MLDREIGNVSLANGKYIYTVSQRKLIFCSLSVKYEPISIKIGKNVPE